MDSCVIELTPAAEKHGNLYLTNCPKDFFPDDIYGDSSLKNGRSGNPVILEIEGYGRPVKTDIPKDIQTGKSRRFFRTQRWVRRFISTHNLKPKDKITIERISERRYSVRPANKQLTFIDLFAGIGGMRIAFEKAGCKCVFTSEWDKFAQQTYEANFGEKPWGDIRKIKSEDIPDHDILVAGFPCQPFSISGVSKKNSLGRPHGFDDPTQGTLFFEIKRIIQDKKPYAFLLENVKNLKSHDKGRTYKVIYDTLVNLGYTIYDRVIDADAYVPQHRERIFIVGFRNPTVFNFPDIATKEKPKFKDVLERNVSNEYTLTDHQWKYHQGYAEKHRKKGNGFGYGMADMDGRSRTLSARYYKDGSEIFVPQGKGKNPRRLTPRECANLMGFTQLKPDFEIPVSKTQAYKQFGNAVVVPLVYDIATHMVKSIGNQQSEGK